MAEIERLTEDLIAELQRSEERFRTICEKAPVMIDQFDERGRCCLWNRECERQLGYTRAEIEASDDPLVLCYPDLEERARVREALERADGEFREYRVRAKDGRYRIQMWADFRLPDGSSISVGHDVTEHRKTEEQLRQSQKMEALGQLTGGMAHDFNNLLTVIVANAEMLLREMGMARPSERRFVEEIIDATSRGGAMIRKLLAFSRSDVLRPQLVDAASLVQELAPTLSRLLPDSIQVRVTSEPSLPAIEADAGAVEQILMNLVTNARDAMPGGGLLTASTEKRWVDATEADEIGCPPGAYVAIRVRDDGTGMDDQTAERVFEPFFTTKTGTGTGLGLPMVEGLMAQLGGAVAIETEVGLGTTVELLFPIPKGEATASRPPARVGAKRVLVVEDEPAIRRVVTELLVQEGFDVEGVPNGRQALKLLETSPGFDLVLCDLVMPEMSGADLYRSCSRLPHRPPFLFVTGTAADEVARHLDQNDDLRVLQKPYRVEQLLVAVARTWALPRTPLR